MLRFLRNIRRQLIGGNKFKKYLLYAVGEILLVVVGILIALYLDDLQAQKRLDAREQAYLTRFEKELEANLLEMDRLLVSSDSTLVRIDSLIAVSLGELPPVSHTTFNRLAVAALDYLVFMAAEATVEDLVGTGDLDIIRDPDIREAIASWKSGLMTIRSLETDNKKAFNDLLEYYRTHSEVYRMLRGGPIFDASMQQQVLADPVFLNSLTYHAIPLQLLREEYVHKKSEFRDLHRKVGEYLAGRAE
ncbi:hypothetical protein [Robiginitalea sp. SC105]|uniref:hypothetical protein n=1 Tax=Robiginitalea sp. SC105 TaxID=2762332 RepID=UPI00163AFC7C|nr:hypothetical protein [Robiginitalea sp. SC105]MBC2838826.1 hypothetical protein [Robiginitalea sp. SC105]